MHIKSRGQLGVFLQELVILFLKQGLSLDAGSHHLGLDSQANEPRDSPVVTPQHGGVTSVHCHIQLFHVGSKDQTWVFTLSKKHFTHRITSTALVNYF